MGFYFEANSSPTKDLIDELSRVTSHTPFNTSAYAAAAIGMGKKPCILALRSDNKIISGCLGFLQGGILSRRLEIMTAPIPLEAELFWNGVTQFCQKQSVWELDILSFGSDATDIPSLPNKIKRYDRCEYLIDLTCSNPLSLLSKGHRRNINRATKAGLNIQRSREAKAARRHLDLIAASMQRRNDRGEDVSIPTETRFTEAMLEAGAGEIYQAMNGETVLSSIMILRSSDCAYYQSAGTSPEGMSIGASMFLISEVANILKDEGVSLFNLGGAGPEEQGLQRFKGGFGARKVLLEAATFSMVSPIKRKFRTAAKLILRNPIGFFAALIRIERYVVFSGRPVVISKPVETMEDEHIIFKKLTDEELVNLSETDNYREQAERFRRLGFNSAYGLYWGEELVNVSWLIDATLDRKNKIRNVKLRAGEGEITHGLTGKQFRRRGFRKISIDYKYNIAVTKGIKTIFAITGEKNLPSQRGIEKAGLSRCGSIVRIAFSFGPEWMSLTWRGHRWNP